MELVVFWSQLAESKLEDIYFYYKLKAGTQIAQKLVNGIVDTTIDLNLNPKIGQTETLLNNRSQNFRFLVYKNYKIIYWINTEFHRIEIATVFDCRQNPQKLNKLLK
jgi:plasmid stabilization system protein ParE